MPLDPRYWQINGWRANLCALVAGSLVPLSFAPFNWWPLGLLSAALLAWLLRWQSGWEGFKRSIWFGIGLYGAGASWVYVSIHQFGFAAAWLAATLTGLFVFGMALVFALPFYFYSRFFAPARLGYLVAFPAFWVLGEWLRSWLLTGFPWLYLGYGHIDTWLSGWAPLFGVLGVSFAAVFSAAAISYAVYDLIRARLQPPGHRFRPGRTYATLAAVLLVWVAGWGLCNLRWTQPAGDSISVGMVQGNIAQELKWQPFYLAETMAIYRHLSSAVWDKDWVVWPEAAMPLMYHDATDFLAELDKRAEETNTAFISGILYDDQETGAYYNTIIGLGEAQGIYHKQRLVPFGEYMPLEYWLRGLIRFFDLPTSIIAPGPANQKGLTADGYSVSPFICYEIVYPDLVAANAWDSELLITISNDAWFGNSIGPLQHFQMARMRALENGRYLVRATNNGVSGIIGPTGDVLVTGGRFTREVITGEVKPMQGHTPFAHWRSLPVVFACAISLVVVGFLQRRRRLVRQLLREEPQL
jgi:apolipoprotein N-acyltransferase